MKPILVLAALLAFAAPAWAQTFGISITESNSGDYDLDVNQALSTEASATSLTLFWDEADKNGSYAPDFDWPTIANSYYPGKGVSLVLSLAVIDTVTERRPEALRGMPFDDPRVLARFESYASEVLTRLEDTDLVAISIGNEVDGYLTTPEDWAEFAGFFAGAVEIVHQLRPGVPVGFTATWDGFRGENGPHILRANQAADALFINYYPLDSGFQVLPPADISNQLDAMVALAAGKPVFLTETGYPSGGCGSSEAIQLEYFQKLLAALEAREGDIPLAMLVWLHDITPGALDHYRRYYGVPNPCFLSYLGTLGLRTNDGQNKPAFEWLVSR